jgi:hypothetical protein
MAILELVLRKILSKAGLAVGNFLRLGASIIYDESLRFPLLLPERVP